MFAKFQRLLAFIWLSLGLISIWYGVQETFFLPQSPATDVSRNWLDKHSFLLLFGSLGLYLFWEAWSNFREAGELAARNRSDKAHEQHRKQRIRKQNDLALPNMPDDYPDKISKMLGLLREYDIQLLPRNVSPEATIEVEDRFVTALWREMVDEAMSLDGYRRALSVREIPATTPYDILFYMREEDGPPYSDDQPYSKDVMHLLWNDGEGENTYRNHALALRDLARGELPLENIKEIVLNKHDLRHRELRLRTQGKDHVYPFEAKGKELNIEVLLYIGDLMRTNGQGYRFATFGDGQIVRLADTQLDSFSQLIGEKAVWLDNGGAKPLTKGQTG